MKRHDFPKTITLVGDGLHVGIDKPGFMLFASSGGPARQKYIKADDVAELVASARDAHRGFLGLVNALEKSDVYVPSTSPLMARFIRLQRAIEAWEGK